MSLKNLILLNVIGTNGQTRQQKVVAERFDTEGHILDAQGNVVPGKPGLTLMLGGVAAPDFPALEYAAAQKSGDKAKISAVLLAHSEMVAAWEASNEGGTDELKIAKACLQYCVDHQGFLDHDGDGFVLKLENLDITVNDLTTGGKLYTVAGTAVFGRAASAEASAA
jgi:hypothetical protein